MFVLETTEISRAIENAKALHPKVKMIRFGEYSVTGSRGNTYFVRCYRDKGRKVVDCACQTREGVACKHGMAAVSLHIAMAARLRAEMRNGKNNGKCQNGKPEGFPYLVDGVNSAGRTRTYNPSVNSRMLCH
jgi:hypothetical protein